MCFPMNFVKFLRTHFYIEHLWWLLLKLFKKRHDEGQKFNQNGSSEAVVWRCSVEKVFLEISHNSQENTCARDSFLIKLQP